MEEGNFNVTGGIKLKDILKDYIGANVSENLMSKAMKEVEDKEDVVEQVE